MRHNLTLMSLTAMDLPGKHVDTDDERARRTVAWAWSQEETERRNRSERPDTAAELEPPDAFSDEYATRRLLAQIRPDADPEATGPGSRTVRGLLCGACAGWGKPPTSAELYDAMRAENPTDRQLAIAGVLVNEAGFDELLNAHTEGAFTWRQLARAAAKRGYVPPGRIRWINAFATRPTRRGWKP